jgi:glycosyltransferase involved in cell wall biosynthesis
MVDRYRQAIPNPWEDRRLRANPAVNDAFDQTPALMSDSGKAVGLVPSTDTEHMRRYASETLFVSKLAFIRNMYGRRADLREVYPNVFFADAPKFAAWMTRYGAREELVPDECIATFMRCSGGRSLARIFSFLNRTPEFVDMWPMGLVGEGRDELARALLRLLRNGLEFDVDDVVMYVWMMEDASWSGVELTLELLPHLARTPSSRLPEGYEAMFAAQVAREPRFGDVVRGLAGRHQSPAVVDELKAIRTHQKAASQPKRATEYLRIRRQGPATAADGQATSSGVNLFGFFKSPIGLGEMSRGLSSALATIDVQTAENVVGNVAMDPELRPSDFIRRFRHDFDRNIFVSYPHLDGVILHHYPGWMTADRENIAYLAWEQRDGSHYWREVFEGFDQIWALSSFAARSLEQCLERPVHDVPCVLEINKLPPAGSKSEFGLDPNALVVLYVFDANSSIERKNPEAALRAFATAFGPHDPVQLCIKASNAARMEHRSRLRAFLRDATKLGDRVKIITENMSRERTLKLISSVDCYMSLHRAEGFGYTCAEAMAYGVPVIATRYSGNLDFMDDESAYLVDAREVEVQRAEGPFHRGSVWADPNLDSAIHALQTVLNRRQDARLLGLRGQAQVRCKLSAEAIGARVASLLGTAQAPKNYFAPTSAESLARS